MIEQVTGDRGAIEALSYFLHHASGWAKDRPDATHLWLPLALAGDEVWEAGADIAGTPSALRALSARPAIVRSSVVQRPLDTSGPTLAPPKPAPVAGASAAQRR